MDFENLYSERAHRMKASDIREILAVTQRSNVISFAGGLPDTSTFPVQELRAITLAVLEREPQLALQYGPTEGDARLRDELVTWMARDGITVTATRC